MTVIPPPVPWESCQGCSSSHSEMRSASSTFFPESAKLLLLRKSWSHTHVNNSAGGARCGGAPSSDQLATDAMSVSSGKRSKLGASTYLHQATGVVTTANLCFRHADILHNVTVTPSQSPTEFSLAITIEIINREWDLRIYVSNLIAR